MWADNETDLDLLGFDVLVDELVVALTDPRLLPLTVGVLGDWGSGKNSLLRLTRRELEADPDQRYLCVSFSPWEFEDYDDVKVALLQAILDACQARSQQPGVTLRVTRLRRFGRRLAGPLRRAGHAAIAASPAALPVAMGLLDPSMGPDTLATFQQVAGVIAPVAASAVPAGSSGAPSAAASDPPDIRDLVEFRRVFQELLDELNGVDALVVFVDDLDRCLPDTIVDTFEAIRLFLNSPRTAYVVGASRSIVESAIDSRYPSLRREDGRGVGHDYLEKMLQLQVSLPALSPGETETYVNALIAQLHVSSQQWDLIEAWLKNNLVADPFGEVLNAAVLGDVLGDGLPPDLAVDLAWTGQISAALSAGLRGNPRQVKRFLNDLTWRRRAARRRGIDLRHDVLAKLMVLEETELEDLQIVFDWQLRTPGPTAEVARAQAIANPSTTAPNGTGDLSGREPLDTQPDVRGDVADLGVNEETGGVASIRGAGPVSGPPPRRSPGRKTQPPTESSEPADADPPDPVVVWASRPQIRRWLNLVPDLSGTDLRPYFSYFRSRLSVTPAATALPRVLQALVLELTGSSRQFQSGAVAWAALGVPEQDLVVEALVDAVRRHPDGEAIQAVARLAGREPRVGPRVIETLGAVPHTMLPVFKLPGVLGALRHVDGYPAWHARLSASQVPGVARVAMAVPPQGARS